MKAIRIIGLALFVWAIYGSCLALTAEEEQKRLVAISGGYGANKDRGKALEGIPEDLAIHYSTQRCSGELYWEEYQISTDGNISYKEARNGFPSGRIETYPLTKQELQQLVLAIENNGFFNLDKSYKNRPEKGVGKSEELSVATNKKSPSETIENKGIVMNSGKAEGSCMKLSVTMNKKSHSVTVENAPEPKELGAITNMLYSLVRNKRPNSLNLDYRPPQKPQKP